VLLVDDNEEIRKVGFRLLEHLGYTALTAGSGSEAMTIYQQDDAIELVILDVVMPDISGQDLASQLLSVDPTVKLIAISGYALDPGFFQNKGFLDLILKPFNITSFAQILSQSLRT